MTTVNPKYKLKEFESKGHKWAKNYVFEQLRKGSISNFYEETPIGEYEGDYLYTSRNQVKVKGNHFKLEYPFFTKPIALNCFKCEENKCEKCYYIDNTKIKFITDIIVMNRTYTPVQVIEIVSKNDLTPGKVDFYKVKGLDIIVIKSSDIADLVRDYKNLKVHKIIEGDSK
jgi:hypothetical protein